MHIEPGVVQGAKMALSYGTAVAAGGIALKAAYDEITKQGPLSLIVKALLSTVLVFIFFQVFPHYPVGVSEVHLIFGTTLFLIFGTSAAAFGLAGGLLLQGLFFAQTDLPMYFVNISTLLFPLFAVSLLAKKIIPEKTAYKDIKYTQALQLSVVFQAGIVGWVMFWAFYGQGFQIASEVFSFGAAYMSVIIVEPLVDLAVLALVKTVHSLKDSKFVNGRLFKSAVEIKSESI